MDKRHHHHPSFEAIATEVINDEENEAEKPKSSRGFFLVNVLSKMLRSVNFTLITEEMRLGSSSRASCLMCNAVSALYLSPFYSKESMVAAARSICINFRLQTERVCKGLVDSFMDDLDYIRRHSKLTRREMCGVLFGIDCAREVTKNLNWTIAIPPRKNLQNSIRRTGLLREGSVAESRPLPSVQPSVEPLQHKPQSQSPPGGGGPLKPPPPEEVVPSPLPSEVPIAVLPVRYGHLLDESDDDLNEEEVTSQGSLPRGPRPSIAYESNNYASSSSRSRSEKQIVTAVQITDIHVDPYYTPGAKADCGEPLCCRQTDGFAKNPEEAAGPWGDYRSCDTPVATLRHALKHISDNHPSANYWMWTGDVAPHDIWNVTRDEVISQIELVTSLMKQYAKVPVFPVIGNHEGVPVNSFPPPEVKGPISISWLYEAVAKEWSYWLPDEALETLRYGGYYTVKVRPGFRVICINTNYCTRLNPWTLYDPVDPGNQLAWLVRQLHEAEMATEKVHIIGHIPPDNKECTQAWLFNFLRIIDRFQHLVLAQYYGHTHRDEFRILYSPYATRKPINVAYIGPSITPFTENNPAYRVYHSDLEGYIKDHETYFFNLTDANLSDEGPQWLFEYKAVKTFGLEDMGPDGWHRFVARLTEDDSLFQHYHKLYYRWSEVKRWDTCDQECKQAILDDLIVDHPLKTKPRRLFGLRRKH